MDSTCFALFLRNGIKMETHKLQTDGSKGKDYLSLGNVKEDGT